MKNYSFYLCLRLKAHGNDICLFFSTTDIDEVWDQSDWIISFSGENITDISEKKDIKKSDIKFFISGIKTR